ncbi:MAG: LuxR C-terminal-related transcriptional regulator [Slackia sp.]
MSSASMRKELILHDAEKLQKEFGLPDREAEVVALYALGKTQQAIAEELCITPATVRAHQTRLRQDRPAFPAGDNRPQGGA